MKDKYFFVLPLIFFYIFLTIYPFLYMIYISFFNYNLASGANSTFSGLYNYLRIPLDPIAQGSVSFTIFITFSGLVIETMLGLAIAFLVIDARGEKFFRMAIIIPMMIPMAVSGMIWRMLYNTLYGPVNYFLSFFGVARISWLGDPAYAPLALLITDIWQWTPFMFLIFYSGIKGISPTLVESAMVDGAGDFDLIRYIRIPLIKDLIIIGALLRTIDLLKLFDTVYMITGGGPGTSTYSYSYLIYVVGFLTGINLGYASALSVVLLIIVTALVAILIRLLNIGQLLGLSGERI
ncbi:MAG: carbohydrate ABC transporter permease [Nitrososphaeria archaeon]